jgi:hypothetical protein
VPGEHDIYDGGALYDTSEVSAIFNGHYAMLIRSADRTAIHFLYTKRAV